MFDPPFVHHRDAIAHDQRFVLVVGDEDRGDAEVAQDMAQLDLHGLAQLAVEGREGLVEKQEAGLDHHRAGHGDALLLPPESAVTARSAKASMRTRPSASATFFACSAFGTPLALRP